MRPVDAVVLAAGRGSRLGEDVPKCLVDIGGAPLIHHQLAALGAAGVRDVTVVVGFRADDVRRTLPAGVRTVENPDFATTNSMYSFWLARHLVGSDVMVLNADVLFDPAIARRLVRRAGSAVAFDSTSGADEEEMKVQTRDGALVRMSKALPPEYADGENVGVLTLTRRAARTALAAAEALLALGRRRDWLASAINATAQRHRLCCLDVGALPWVEIDFPADLRHARERVLPALDGAPPALPLGAVSAA